MWVRAAVMSVGVMALIFPDRAGAIPSTRQRQNARCRHRPLEPLLRQSLTTLLLAAAALLSACDSQRIEKLEEGLSSEADVRKQFGDPVTITEKADGTKVMEYPRQPEGSTNYLITIAADGKMSALRQLLTPANFAKVQPGQSQDELRKLLGKPAKKHSYAMKPDEEVWDWRFMDGQVRKVFAVTFGADKTVLRSETGEDQRDTHTGG